MNARLQARPLHTSRRLAPRAADKDWRMAQSCPGCASCVKPTHGRLCLLVCVMFCYKLQTTLWALEADHSLLHAGSPMAPAAGQESSVATYVYTYVCIHIYIYI